LGDCGSTAVELELVRPNLYFLLDRSGSMAEPIPGTLPQNRLGAASVAIEQVLRQIGHRVNFGASVFPADTSTCGPGEEVQPLGPGDPVSYALSNKDGPQLQRLVFNLRRVAPEGVTPTAAALTALHDTLAAFSGHTYLFLLTDGAPNCNAALACAATQCTANIEMLPYADMKLCDDTVNCCDANIFGSEACLDSDATLAAVSALSDVRVRTFVIGMPGTETYEDLLNELAQAGGTARPQLPFYYKATDSDELADTLKTLGGQASLSCSIELNQVPPDPSLVNVFLDDTLIAFDEADGWSWKDEGTVQLNGPACDLAQGGQVLQIQVVAGCPVFLR
jgi:hypothetical protein